MGQSVEREVRWEPPFRQLDEHLPHAAASGIVGEGEVDRAVEEFLKVLLTAFVDLVRAPDNRDAGIVTDPFLPPLCQSFLYPLRIVRPASFRPFFTFRFLFFGGPYLINFVDVDHSRLICLGGFENHSHHFVAVRFIRNVFVDDGRRAKVEHYGFGFVLYRLDHKSFSSPFRPIEQH